LQNKYILTSGKTHKNVSLFERWSSKFTKKYNYDPQNIPPEKYNMVIKKAKIVLISKLPIRV